MKTLQECLADAKEKGIAIGHFNVANIEMFHAVLTAAEKTGQPVIIGVAEGERDFIGIPEIVSLIKTAREKASVPIFLNADHTYSVERVKEAIDAGFDSVIFDGAKLPFEENIAKTKECVEYAKASGRNVLVEGEIGYIGVGSQVWDSVPEGAITSDSMMTTPEEAQRFVEETGVDLLAPAVGNIHGIIEARDDKDLSKKFVEHLNPLRVKAIADAVQTPLVLHGGSGLPDDDFTAGITAGIRVVHISTEMRRAERTALEKSLAENQKELAPYKILKPALEAVEKVVEERIKLFAGL